MRRLLYILTVLFIFWVTPQFAAGQITIQQETNAESRRLEQKPDERFVSPEIQQPGYVTQAIMHAERRRMRQERNTFTFVAGLQANQTQFTNWAKGGDNTFNGLSTLDISHVYKKERLSYTTKFDARYGLSVIDGSTFKNEDKFNLNFQTAWSISRHWSLSGTANLRSQFTKGYKSRTDKTYVSDFMSPGVLDLSLGFTYKPKNWNITISPITGSMLFVLSDSLSTKGINGIDPGDHFKPMVGPSLSAEYGVKFAQEKIHFRSKFYGFWNFRLDPNARWENWLDIYTTKWLKTSAYLHMIYDKEASVPRKEEGKYLQTNYTIGLALTLTYKSKKN